MPTLVVDNGGCNCRVGWADEESPRIVAPNATAHQKGSLDVFVADQIHRIKNKGTLTYTRPCERGIVTNWPCQLEIWSQLLPQVLGQSAPLSSFSSATLLATCAPFTPAALTDQMDQIAFEELGFGALQRLPAAAAAACLYQAQSEKGGQLAAGGEIAGEESAGDPSPQAMGGALCCLVLDLGFSATYAVPSFRGKAIQGAVRRLNVGGRLLTSALQEALSYRQYSMMDEEALIGRAKEELCYVAPSSLGEEAKRRVGPGKPAAESCYREWVLPTYHGTKQSDEPYLRELPVDPTTKRFIRTRKNDESAAQCLRFDSERFAIPDILFHPSDIGLDQGGLHELVAEAVASCDPALQPLLFGNVVLVGGGANLANLKSRLLKELRPLVPSHWPLEVSVGLGPGGGPGDPALCGWRGAAHLARTCSGSAPAAGGGCLLATVTKAEYEERGGDWCREQFENW